MYFYLSSLGVELQTPNVTPPSFTTRTRLWYCKHYKAISIYSYFHIIYLYISIYIYIYIYIYINILGFKILEANSIKLFVPLQRRRCVFLLHRSVVGASMNIRNSNITHHSIVCMSVCVYNHLYY